MKPYSSSSESMAQMKTKAQCPNCGQAIYLVNMEMWLHYNHGHYTKFCAFEVDSFKDQCIHCGEKIYGNEIGQWEHFFGTQICLDPKRVITKTKAEPAPPPPPLPKKKEVKEEIRSITFED